ncbi:cystatin-B-like [Ruditapes philippinarum]|uniref:cystatin-B-like n=1 Tax=Ruditapes philippinarum TaxID=129788 RepID=UPI00295AC042|nr:cystatin-B-like [Ruditapes philippinarum]
MAQMCGGAGDVMPADEEVKGYCNEVKADILKKAGKDSVEIFEPVHYRSQVVAGVNYFVKIRIGSGGECLHARIFKGLPHTGGNLEVSSVQTNKKVEDAVEYF